MIKSSLYTPVYESNKVSEFEVFALFKKLNKKVIFCPQLTPQLHDNKK